MTNAEYIVNKLMDYMEYEGIEFQRESHDDVVTRMCSFIKYDLACPYAYQIPPHTKCYKEPVPETGEDCFQCKYAWLSSEVEA